MSARRPGNSNRTLGTAPRASIVVAVLAAAAVLGWWGLRDGDERDPASSPAQTGMRPGGTPQVARAIGQGRLVGWWPEAPAEVAEVAVSTTRGVPNNIHPGDYAGPARCKTCHPKNHASWSGHAHRLMNTVATRETVLGDFSGEAVVRQQGGRATFFATRVGAETAPPDMRWWMQLERDDVRRTYRITQTIGSRFYQYYVGRLVKGPERPGHDFYKTDHVLPFGYWLDARKWVPVVHVHREVPELDREDPFVGAGELKRFAPYAQGCNGCHTTFPLGDMFTREPLRLSRHAPWQLHWNLASYIREQRPGFFDADAKSASTIDEGELQQLGRSLSAMDARDYGVSLGISCEACHLGSRRHAENPKELPRFAPASDHLLAETRVEVIEGGRNHTNLNWACARCHAGSRSEFAAGMGTWNSIEYTDATRGGCYTRLLCIDCHDPHKAIGKQWTRTQAQDEAVCLRCHGDYKDPDVRQRHTHHVSGSRGDGCLNCHMPRINEGLQDVVRTHTIFSPTHPGMIESNHPNACNLCHVAESIDWTVAWLAEWYGLDGSRLSVPGDGDTPLGRLWLLSDDEAVRLVGGDAILNQQAGDVRAIGWSLVELVSSLDDEFLINRQFAAKGIEQSLGVRLEELGYRFYDARRDRAVGLARVRRVLLGKGGSR